MSYIFSLLLFLQFPLINDISPATTNNENKEISPISTYEEDLTNDGFKEMIELNGKLLSKESEYFQTISIAIKSLDKKQWDLHFSGGYQPKIRFLDLIHNGTSDLFYQSSMKNNDGPYDHYLYTLKNQKLTEIPLPQHPYVEGRFLDDFQIEIKLSPLGKLKPVIFDIDNQAKKYIKAGIYHQNGQILKDLRVQMDPISRYEPVKIGTKKGYGLKSYQHAYGIDHTDHLGTVETFWYYENNRWTILQTNWVS